MATYSFDDGIKNIPTNKTVDVAKTINNKTIKIILKKMEKDDYKNDYNLGCKLDKIIEKYKKNQKNEPTQLFLI